MWISQKKRRVKNFEEEGGGEGEVGGRRESKTEKPNDDK